ncbi:hypothetical protein Tco_1013644 [Tanacetum coccineum]
MADAANTDAKKVEEEKANEEQKGNEQAMDEQANNDQVGALFLLILILGRFLSLSKEYNEWTVIVNRAKDITKVSNIIDQYTSIFIVLGFTTLKLV